MSTDPTRPPIDLLTEAGRQAISDQFGVDRQTAIDYHQQLTALEQQFREDVREVDWASSIAPVVDEAMDHVRAAIAYVSTVSQRQQDLDMDLEDAGGVDADMDAALFALAQARHAASDELARLSGLALRLGQCYRDELVRQMFTPPTT